MRTRYQYVAGALSALHLRPAIALRRALSQGYGMSEALRDLRAGLIVSVVALPLSMALAIASGVRPENGLYTAIVAGAFAAALGGSKVQITGPTAAFVVILAPVSSQHGLAGLAIATIMAGLLLMAMGLLRLGRYVEFIPDPVTTAFTAGIGVVIATLQIKDMLGLHVPRLPDHYIDKVAVLIGAAREKYLAGPLAPAMFGDLVVGGVTLALLMLLPRVVKRVPVPLVALPIGAALGWLLSHQLGWSVETIQTRFASPGAPWGLSGRGPSFAWPWNEPGPLAAGGGGGVSEPFRLTLDVFKSLMGSAFAFAVLGAIASLLSAVVTDGMTGKRHDPDAELLAQGVGNVVAPFFGGFAASGAIARTITNVRSGACSPIAALVHCAALLGCVVLLPPVLAHVPMASLAALLLVVARNMADMKHVGFLLRFSPAGDVFVLVLCFALTVVFDMSVAVGVGVVSAAILFMRRMAETSTVRLIGPEHPVLAQPVPRGVLLYDIGGPLFFGAAAKAMSTLSVASDNVRVVVLDLTDVPSIDATGLVNLDSLITRLERRDVFTVLAGVQPQPAEVMTRNGWMYGRGKLAVCGDLGTGVEIARAWIEQHP